MMLSEFATRDDLAGIHHNHSVRNGFEEFDAVLDDQNRNIHFLGQHSQDLVDFVDLCVDEPGSRFIHQENLGLAHQQTRHQQLASLKGLQADGRPVVRHPEVNEIGAVFGVKAS